jgi:hypothetical protein
MPGSQLSRSEGNRRGNTGGNTPSARGVPPRAHLDSRDSRSTRMLRAVRLLPPTSINAASWRTHAPGGALCRPASTVPSARRSIAVPWRERPSFWTGWPAKPAASEVVAHATLSVSPSERSSLDSCIEATLNACRSTSRSFGRRAVIVRLATRALKALRTATIPLRPRCARLAALIAQVATRARATIDGQLGSA